MSGQVIFFDKNLLDLSIASVQITVTDSVAVNDGSAAVDFLRNRSNSSAWITTGSNDTANTTLLANWIDYELVDSIMLVKHNFKNFTVEGFSGMAWEPILTETNNTKTTTFIETTLPLISQIRIVVYETMVADDDKEMYQLIATKKLGVGRLEGFPLIKSPRLDTRKKISKMLSGKINIMESLGSFSCKLSVENWKSDVDLSIVESIYLNRSGVLMSLSGFREEQFSSSRYGYRDEDIFFVRPKNDWRPEWYAGVYSLGMKVDMDLEECIE